MQMVAFRTASGGGMTPAVNLSSTSVNFGNEQTGTTSNPQSVTLTNIGGGQLAINTIAISGGNAGDFAQEQFMRCDIGARRQLQDQCDFYAFRNRRSQFGHIDH